MNQDFLRSDQDNCGFITALPAFSSIWTSDASEGYLRRGRFSQKADPIVGRPTCANDRHCCMPSQYLDDPVQERFSHNLRSQVDTEQVKNSKAYIARNYLFRNQEIYMKTAMLTEHTVDDQHPSIQMVWWM